MRHGPSRRVWRRIIGIATGMVVAVFVGESAAIHWASRMLFIEEYSGSLDAIVVLGGENHFRANRAALLVWEDQVPLVIVSGLGDGDELCRRLVSAGVQESSITVESVAQSTWENAVNCASIVRRHQVRRVAIVTSWYHSRRALQTFRKVLPEVEICSVPSLEGSRGSPVPFTARRELLRKEYVKIGWYWCRHGVRPW